MTGTTGTQSHAPSARERRFNDPGKNAIGVPTPVELLTSRSAFPDLNWRATSRASAASPEGRGPRHAAEAKVCLTSDAHPEIVRDPVCFPREHGNSGKNIFTYVSV